ncbi:MAG: hypothetical protein IT343_02615 [Candidatus Melainabacteria bacterium]|jgi:hypothetical protein|nr:hypothetical protein [Candidatus Melainabacteria bacterium]
MRLLVNSLIGLSVTATLFCAVPALADTDSEPSLIKASCPEAPIRIAQADTKSDVVARAQNSLLADVQDPTRRIDALGSISEILGIASGLMLLTGAILALCVKKFGLVKLMVPAGIISIILAIAAPGVLISSSSLEIAIAIAVLFLLDYLAVFFLPTFLALRENASNKLTIIVINAAGFIIPGAGLIALYMALKKKQTTQETPPPAVS